MNTDRLETQLASDSTMLPPLYIHAARRELLGFLLNHDETVKCPKCGTKQVQLMPAGTVSKPEWRCRRDKTRFGLTAMELAWPQVALYELMMQLRRNVAKNPDFLTIHESLKSRLMSGADDGEKFYYGLKATYPELSIHIEEIEQDAKLLFQAG